MRDLGEAKKPGRQLIRWKKRNSGEIKIISSGQKGELPSEWIGDR
jgi:hypothetical protein